MKKAKKQSEKKEHVPSSSHPSPRRWWLVGGVFAGVLMLTGAAAGMAVIKIGQLPEAYFVNDFTVTGVDLHAVQTFEEAQNQVTGAAQNFLNQSVNFSSERGEKMVVLAQAGLQIDPSAVNERLATFMARSAFQKTLTYLFGEDLSLDLSVDEAALKAAFADSGIEQGVKKARYAMNGGTVVVEPEQIGYGIDTVTLAGDLSKAWQNQETLTSFPLPLLTSEPELVSTDLEPFLALAQKASGFEWSLMDEYGNDYKMTLAEHLDWLLPSASAEVTPTLALSQEALATYVQTTLGPDIEEEPVGAVITQNEDGSYHFEGSARFGKTIDALALAAALETQLQTGLEAEEPSFTALQIPVTRLLPPVTVPDALKALGVTDLVGVGYSDFSGSPSGRVHNINEGINQFNGVLIQKDEEFSFMEHLSPVDAEHGFLPELVIKGDETIPEYGGGMCQVSSTMFRAALYSGLPITARTNHSYAVSYYARPFGYGLDATVYDPSPDFKFLNDTAGALLVQSYTDGNSAYYVFYGTNDARQVTMDGPYAYDYRGIPPDVVTYTDALAPGERKLKDHGHQGFKVDWNRTILYSDGSSKTETIHSDYQARPEKWEEGTPLETTDGTESAPATELEP